MKTIDELIAWTEQRLRIMDRFHQNSNFYTTDRENVSSILEHLKKSRIPVLSTAAPNQQFELVGDPEE